MSKIAFYTLGCKVNQVETEQWKEGFYNSGDEIVDFNDTADVYIINTCTVTHVADRKARAIIRRTHRRKPEAFLVVTGCMAQVFPEQIEAITGVNLIIGAGDKENLVDIVRQCVDKAFEQTLVFRSALTDENKIKPIFFTHAHDKTRAFIKIQDGCQSFCTFCIVPFARGPVRSKLPFDVLHEAQQLLQLGYKEIVLTGIHTGYYGIDLDHWNLQRLLLFLEEHLNGDYRIRLSSLEPVELTDDFLQTVSSLNNLCPHFHIPLQSGSNQILQAMNRRYSREYYRALIEKIILKYKQPALFADVMVGFPGETDKDFQATYDLLVELPFSDLHVFKYSPRAGTGAAKLQNQVDENVKTERSAVLLELAEKKKYQYKQLFLDTVLRVLVERECDTDFNVGLSDNYLDILCSPEDGNLGEFINVKITGQANGMLLGEKV